MIAQPPGTNRLYGGYVAPEPNTGLVSWVNDFGGTIEAGTLSLIEMATVCQGVNPDATVVAISASTIVAVPVSPTPNASNTLRM